MSATLPKSMPAQYPMSGRPRLWTHIWRGAVGGALIPIISLCITLYSNSYSRLFLVAFLILIWIPIGYGALLGFTLWLVQRNRSGGLSMIQRVLLGFSLTVAASLPFVHFFENRKALEFDLKRLLLDALLYGLMVGGPAALFLPAWRRRIKHKATV